MYRISNELSIDINFNETSLGNFCIAFIMIVSNTEKLLLKPPLDLRKKRSL